DRDRQRHDLRVGRRCMDAGCPSGVSDRPQDSSRARLGQLLPPVPGACGLWRIQTVGHRPRDAQNDVGTLSTDEEYAHLIQQSTRRSVLTDDGAMMRWEEEGDVVG